jgi:hypothetical protein
MTLDPCSFVAGVCCGFWLHCRLDVAVCCGCWFRYFLVVFVTSFIVVVRFIVVSVLLMFVGFCGLHCSFDVVVTLLLMSVLVGNVIIDTPL